MVRLTSVDSKCQPGYEESNNYFYYVENKRTNNVYLESGFRTKEIIHNVLKTQVKDPNEYLSKDSGYMLVIFETNIFPTVEKAYYYELISYFRPENDIKIYNNERRNEFL